MAARPQHNRIRATRAPAIAAAIGVASLLSACAVGPDFKPAETPPGADYTPAPLPPKTDSAPVHGGEAQHFALGHDIEFDWWTLFKSPALDALVAQAFKANPTIDAAVATLKQAQEQVYAQQGFFYPTMQANYTGVSQQTAGNTAGSSAPGYQGNGANITPSRPNAPIIYTFHTAQLTVGFTPDLFGLNRRTVESLEGAGGRPALRPRGGLYHAGFQRGRRRAAGSLDPGADRGDQGDHPRQREVAGHPAGTSSASAMPWASTWRHRRRRWPPRRRCCRRWKSSTSRPAT